MTKPDACLVENVTVTYASGRWPNRQTVTAVDDVSISIGSGDRLAIVGESGCGKTTLTRAMMGLVRPASGHVYLDGVDLARLSRRQMRPLRSKIGIVHQNPLSALSPAMTIGDAVAEPLLAHHLADNRADVQRRVAGLLEQVDLKPVERYLRAYPSQLSGGQRQRAVIARALIGGPSLLIADEPVASLDVSIRGRILELMAELQREHSFAMMIITHDMGVAQVASDRMAVMYLGRVIEDGPTTAVLNDPQHPYTNALLAARPAIGSAVDSRPVHAIHGEVPDPTRVPPGCRFHDRCARAFGRCGWSPQDLVDAIDLARMADPTADIWKLAPAVKVSGTKIRLPVALYHRLPEILELSGRNVLRAGIDTVLDEGEYVSLEFYSPSQPPTFTIGPDHLAACWLHDEAGDQQ